MLIGYARTSTQDLRTNQDCKRNLVEQSAGTLEALSFLEVLDLSDNSISGIHSGVRRWAE